MSKVLYYFTYSFPYGIGETWKANELSSFVHDFDEITIVPFCYGNNSHKKPTPIQVTLAEPVISNYSGFRLSILKVFFSGRLSFYLREFFSKKVYRKTKWLKAWIVAAVYVEYLFRHPIIRRLIKEDDFGNESILYFFWSRENAYIIPFLNKAKFGKIAVRFHGYDLYEERADNAGYIPFRRQLYETITDGIYISNSGLQYANAKYPNFSFRKHLYPLGSLQHGYARMSSDNIFRIYTCSMIVPVKQLHILAQALCLLTIDAEWHHIGDGPEKEKLLKIVQRFPENVKFFLRGFVPPEEVVKQYVDKPIDIFVNVSESEGLPVSIMEALSAGIPIMATNVGGTHEIVNSEVGVLLKKDINSKELAEQLIQFFHLADEEKLVKREAAKRYYAELWNARVNSKKVSAFLSN